MIVALFVASFVVQIVASVLAGKALIAACTFAVEVLTRSHVLVL